MTKRFQMTGAMRIGTAILRALLRVGLPMGPLVLLSVRGRKTGKVYTTPVALVEENGTRWLVAAFGEVNWVHNLRASGEAHLMVPEAHRTHRGHRNETSRSCACSQTVPCEISDCSIYPTLL